MIETLHLLADGKPAPALPARSVPPASPNPPPLPSPVPKSLPAAPASSTAAGAPAARGDAPEVDELTREFVLETQENLAQLVRHLGKLEDAPGDHALISAVFRTLHTLRGNSSFFGFTKLERIARAAEDLLERLRSGALTLTLEMTEVLHDMVEVVRELLAAIQSTGRETPHEYRDLIACLAQLTGVTAGSPSRAPNKAAWPGPAAVPNLQSQLQEFPSPTAAGLSATATAAAPPADFQSQLGDFQPPAAAAPANSEPRAPDLAESTVRVDVGLLDSLMTLVGELVLARNRLLPFAADHAETAYVAATQRLDTITTELQERVMKTRMQPISAIWSKFPRLVRDLAHACGKQVNLVLEGQGTELDRTLLEAVKDPLTHLIRNSVDHGIEPPAARVAAGKPPAGRLLLRACHEGGLVIIEID